MVPNLVSASEIGSWAFCPEALRLDALGHEPEIRQFNWALSVQEGARGQR
jgi:hypothetical protein